MDNNQTKHTRPLHELRIHHYLALVDEAGRMNGSPPVRLVPEQLAAMSGQVRFKANVNRAACKLGQACQTSW